MDKNEIAELAKRIAALQSEVAKQALLYRKPEAESIIATKSRDINAIEHCLDALCEAAFNDEVLLVFKNLCRYYYEIDPQATVRQIQFYREMWDDDEADG